MLSVITRYVLSETRYIAFGNENEVKNVFYKLLKNDKILVFTIIICYNIIATQSKYLMTVKEIIHW